VTTSDNTEMAAIRGADSNCGLYPG
jgi:hypothetical protein